MNAFVLIFLLVTTGSQAACLPDSGPTSKKILMDVRDIENAALDFEASVRSLLPSGINLIVRLEPNSPRTNAEISKSGNELSLVVWGGMLGHPEMDRGTFLLLLCHELGHALGGPPLKSRNGWSSTEGQADYYSGGSCFHLFEPNEELFLYSALKLTSIYAHVTREVAPDLQRCDEVQVLRTNYGYPGVQCRLDTMIAGRRNLPRPRCWYFPQTDHRINMQSEIKEEGFTTSDFEVQKFSIQDRIKKLDEELRQSPHQESINDGQKSECAAHYETNH